MTAAAGHAPSHALSLPSASCRYWPIHPPATCSIWVAIDPADQANGAMGWIPGSHRPGKGGRVGALLPHNTDSSPRLALNQVLDFEASAGVDPANAQLNVLDAGQLSLHDVYLVPHPPANTSANRRAGFVLRYMPGRAAVFDPDRLPTGIRNKSAANSVDRSSSCVGRQAQRTPPIPG